jgi:uncharacterized repeat protein (TIGR01451 family)
MTIACLLGGLLLALVAGEMRRSASAARPGALPAQAGTELENPGFELATGGAPDGWTEYGSVAFRRVATPCHGGAFAAVLTNTINVTRWAYQVVQVAGGQPYELSAWAVKNDARVDGVYAQVRWYGSVDGSGAAIAMNDTNRLIGDDAAYRYVSTGIVTAPVEARSAQVQLRVDPDGSEGDVSATFDDVSFGAANPPVLAADLVVDKNGPGAASPGGMLTYTITLANAGAATATRTLLTDTLPASTLFVTQTSGFAFSREGQVLIWQVGDVSAGSQTTLAVTARVSETAPGTLANHVTATTGTSETSTANNHAAWETRVDRSRVLVSAVLYDGALYGDPDEAVQLANVGAAPADLGGWELCKRVASELGCRPLPSTILSPTARIWLARDAAAFATAFGHPPDHELGSWLPYGLSNAGDEVVLRDGAGTTIDAVVYEKGDTSVAGWSGEPVLPYGTWRQEGQILYRVPDEKSGLPAADTDSASDWIQHSGDPARGRRVLYPGWDLDPLFWPLTATEPATIVVGIAPDAGFAVISRIITRARRSISVETYSLTHPGVVAALAGKAAEGISVTVLLEGSQAAVAKSSARWQQELWACHQIERAGGQCHFLIHEPQQHILGRYDYVHAKFLVVDDEWLVLGSQNLTPRGLPADDKVNGTYGSRGVILATDAPSIVARAARVIALDLDPTHHQDVLRWSPWSTGTYGPPFITYTPQLSIPDHTTTTVRIATPLVVSGTYTFEIFTAPEAALRRSDALLGLVARAGAGDEVYVEQMYEHVNWGNGPNLRLEAYVDAARRGARVRILLNGGSFGEVAFANTNTATVAYVNQIARSEKIDVEAAVGDPTNCGIHSKTVLVRLHGEGGAIHVGSINGSETSSKANREIALQVHSDEVYAYLKGAFDLDWRGSRSLYLPLVARRYTPPADHLLVSEVAYHSWCEWVEIHNPTHLTVTLTAYRLSDAQTATRYEGTYVFPERNMAPGEIIVVAGDASACNHVIADYEMHGTDPNVPNLARDPGWGTGEFGLSNTGDEVLLIGPGGEVVDAIVYGDGRHPGVIAHGLVEPGSTLERLPAYADTDDCRADFTAGWSPGHVRIR